MKPGAWLRTLASLGLLGASAACIQLDPEVFAPIPTSAYLLPDNRILQSEITEVTIPSVGAELAALWLCHPAGGGKAAVLFFGDREGNLDFHWRKIENIYEGGYDVLAVDYRGYGKSTGAPYEGGLYADGELALAHLRSRADLVPHGVIVWGYGLGAAVATHVAVSVAGELPALGAVVLEAPFTSMREWLEKTSPYSPPSEFATEAIFDNLGRVNALGAPVVVVHGQQDRVNPFWMGEAVFAQAAEPKLFIPVERGRHDNLVRLAKAEIFLTLDSY